MCGIIGFSYGPGGAASEAITPTELLKKMFPDVVHRGPHAWGYMHRLKDGEGIDFFKMAGSVTAKGADEEIVIQDEADVLWVVGHVRYATTGSPQENSNNHPILHDHIVGVHNGVLHGYDKILSETGRHNPITKVDSEAIFAAVNKWGVKDGLAKLDGDVAALFADTRDPDALRVARTHSRPLVIGWTEAGTIVFASEEKILKGTGLKFKKIRHLTETNRTWLIRGNQMSKGRQFADPEPENHFPSSRSYIGGVGTTSTSSGHSSYWTNTYQPDRYGGKYCGFNEWEVPGSRVRLSPNEYVDWIFEQKVKEETAKRAGTAAQPVPTAVIHSLPPAAKSVELERGTSETQALAMVGNNGNGPS